MLLVSRAVERSLSAAPLAPGKAITVQDAERMQGFRGDVSDHNYSLCVHCTLSIHYANQLASLKLA